MSQATLKLERELQRRGSLTSGELSVSLQVSQPTVSRMLSRVGKPGILRIGRARASRYAMARVVGTMGDSWPFYAISANGQAAHVGVLHALEAGEWYFQQDAPWESLRGSEFPAGLYPDLPWFLDDLKPQGFLGRAFARKHSGNLGLPADPREWRADDILTALLRHGQDIQGAFVPGNAMLESVQGRLLSRVNAVSEASRSTVYPGLADGALAGDWPGSSAAGEQPKFTACVETLDGAYRPVIVKFSGRGGRPEDRRWADLLAAEHLAASVLLEHDMAAAQTCLVEAGGRCFLESSRFDRMGAYGRRGLVSLSALDGAFFGRLDTPWTAAAERLHATGWLETASAEHLAILWWFGTLIGNTDMHYGNISLFLAKELPLALAPCYDMLPMLYRPDQEGNLPERAFAPPPPPPECRSAWFRASLMAEVYWARVSEADSISKSFQNIAKGNVAVVARYRRQFS